MATIVTIPDTQNIGDSLPDINANYANLNSGKVETSTTIAAGTGLNGGGDLSTNRTFNLADTAVTPGSYVGANITVDQQGRLTSAASSVTGDVVGTTDTQTLTNKTLSSGTIVENASGTTNAQTGTTYTLLVADTGKIITLDNAGAITLTVPTGLGAGFNCTIIQKGAGVVTVTPSGTTVINRQGHTQTAGQGAVIGLYADVVNNLYLTGDTQ